jgi:HAD superfamily hydrolase (TIGR01509 family)
MPCKAVIFDYIGTLVDCKNYTMDASVEKLHRALENEGFNVAKNSFLKAYILAHEKYRKIRYEKLREVTNTVWVSEALCNLGFNVTPDDPRIKVALNIFFKDFIENLELRDFAKKLIEQTHRKCKVGLISNFTFAPVIYKISKFFAAIIVSEEIGWRKPSKYIFEHTLKKLKSQANETVYIGDSPMEDIKGAKQAGLRTIFIPSQFYTLKDLEESKQKPDYIIENLKTASEKINIFEK